MAGVELEPEVAAFVANADRLDSVARTVAVAVAGPRATPVAVFENPASESPLHFPSAAASPLKATHHLGPLSPCRSVLRKDWLLSNVSSLQVQTARSPSRPGTAEAAVDPTPAWISPGPFGDSKLSAPLAVGAHGRTRALVHQFEPPAERWGDSGKLSEAPWMAAATTVAENQAASPPQVLSAPKWMTPPQAAIPDLVLQQGL